MQPSGKVQTYFQHQAHQFDQLYHQETRLHRLVNQWLRRPLYRRFALTLAACGDVQDKQILDVGCGSGRYAVALAERGAQVVGIDFAANMLELARQLAQEARVDARCRFIEADFMDYDFRESFDIALAIGFFDYVADPLPYLARLRQVTTGQVIITFPQPGGWRSWQRRLRYRLAGCPLYFHTQQQMAAAFAEAGFQHWQFIGSWAAAFSGRAGTLQPVAAVHNTSIQNKGGTQWTTR